MLVVDVERFAADKHTVLRDHLDGLGHPFKMRSGSPGTLSGALHDFAIGNIASTGGMTAAVSKFSNRFVNQDRKL